MSEDMKTVIHHIKEFSTKSCNEGGKLVKNCFAKLTLECGKIDSCDNKELADTLVKFATNLLIEARELEKQDLEEG